MLGFGRTNSKGKEGEHEACVAYIRIALGGKLRNAEVAFKELYFTRHTDGLRHHLNQLHIVREHICEWHRHGPLQDTAAIMGDLTVEKVGIHVVLLGCLVDGEHVLLRASLCLHLHEIQFENCKEM